MPTVTQALSDFVKTDAGLAAFYASTGKPFGDTWQRTLDEFLLSTMDEIRLRHAGMACREALRRFDSEDADYFRMAVLRREISRDIAYQKQRDHTAHTVYNWLLGWYLVTHSQSLKTALEKQFIQRNLISTKYTFPEVFGDVFIFVSLLHDIGYMFEGALTPFDSDASVRQASSGMGVVRDYFDHRFWRENKIASMADRVWLQRALELEDVGPRPASTLSGIADSLRYIGETDKIRKAVLAEMKAGRIKAPTCIRTENGLVPDAFQLWKSHFETFSPAMCGMVDAAERVFYSHIESGIDGAGLRVLDHAMCGGLLLLQYSTLYYRVYHGLGESAPADPTHARVWAQFRRDGEGVDYEASFWWTGILWSTAATAIHNILQISQSDWPRDIPRPLPLAMETDALSYLGVLVDCIQEWDRYTVQRHSVFGGSLPVQGRDINLDVSGGRVIVSFQKSSGRAKKVRGALGEALEDWEAIVGIAEV